METQTRILVVDDDQNKVRLLKKQLESFGYHIVVAYDGVEAMEKATAEKPNLIISDILMPRMDGFQLCRKVKESSQLRDIPLVFYTATYTDAKDEQFALSLGASRFILKPTEPDVLTQIIKDVVTEYKEGILAVPEVLPKEEPTYLREYSNRLVKKLEDKVLELEAEITKRKRAEEKIKQAAEEWRTTFDSITDLVSINDSSFRIVRVNKAFAKACKMKPAELVGRTCYEVLHRRNEPISNCPHKKMIETKMPQTEEYFEPRLGLYLEVNSSPIFDEKGSVIASVHVARDITKRKKDEQELQESEAKYSALVEKGNDGIIIIQDSLLKFVNSKMTEMSGFSQKEVIGKSFIDFVSPESKEFVLDMYKKRMSGEEVPSRYEIAILTKDGREISVETNASLIEYKGAFADMAIIRDITERKKIANELKENEEKLRLTFDSVPEGIAVTDLEGNITQVNDPLVSLHGYSTKGELIGQQAINLIAERDRARATQENLNLLSSAGLGGFVEYTLLRKDGSEFAGEISIAPILDLAGKPTGIVAISEDITERKQIQEQLILTDRLASVGELAAGIAHEINNPLTSVISFSDMILEGSVTDDIKEDLELVNKEAHRAAGVVKNLLTFARKHPKEKQPVDINKEIQEVLVLRAYEQKISNITVTTQFDTSIPQITADAFQLQQVFLNLIINAEFFMSQAHGGGTLNITTTHKGRTVKAVFTDDGPGIPKEALEHLFDPFFTTKDVGKGTGLGLSISYGIIKDHGGTIRAKSKDGQGATFIIELPVAKREDK